MTTDVTQQFLEDPASVPSWLGTTFRGNQGTSWKERVRFSISQLHLTLYNGVFWCRTHNTTQINNNTSFPAEATHKAGWGSEEQRLPSLQLPDAN